MARLAFPSFVPHPLLGGGHRQTLAAALAPRARVPYQAVPFHVDLGDGDRLVVHDDCPESWQAEDPLVILCHGLGGCHLSPYMTRIQHHLNQRGVRTWRVDLRGFGHSVAYCSLPGHAGRSNDLHRVLDLAVSRHADSPLALVGFSMGGNIVLKLLGELGGAAPRQLRCAATVAPPIDLLACANNMKQGWNRFYSQRFISRLMKNLRQLQRRYPGRFQSRLAPRPLHLMEFDNRFTAPMSGFRNAQEYYLRCSAAPLLAAIQPPTLILTAEDDPVVPARIFDAVALGARMQLHRAEGGGHVGFFSAKGEDPDRCWMDWRLLQWLASYGIGVRQPSAARSQPAQA